MRGGLFYKPMSDPGAVGCLKQTDARLHANSDRLRVSGAVSLLRDRGRSVLQHAPGQ